MTIAAAPSVPIAASSHSARPKRRSRARANSSAAANVAGKNEIDTTSADAGKCDPPPGAASIAVLTVCAASARPSASQAARSSRFRWARTSTAAVATSTGSPATIRSITHQRIGRQHADLIPVDEFSEAPHRNAHRPAAPPRHDRVAPGGPRVTVGGVRVVARGRGAGGGGDAAEAAVGARERGVQPLRVAQIASVPPPSSASPIGSVARMRVSVCVRPSDPSASNVIAFTGASRENACGASLSWKISAVRTPMLRRSGSGDRGRGRPAAPR